MDETEGHESSHDTGELIRGPEETQADRQLVTLVEVTQVENIIGLNDARQYISKCVSHSGIGRR